MIIGLIGGVFVNARKDSFVKASSNLEINIFLPEAINNPATLAQLENQLGVNFTAAKWYLDWTDDFTLDVAQGFHSQGIMPELTWEPQIDENCVIYQNVLRGQDDVYLNRFAQSVKSLGFPIRITLAPEMNSDWAPWGVGSCGNSAQEFRSFWRYVINKFRAQDVTNVEWIWSPNIHYSDETASFADVFPGDDYIDFTGVEGYNWGTSQSWSDWRSFREVFESSYNDLVALSDKKIIITEFASAELGGDKAQWIREMFSDLQSVFPRIQGITWFNIDKETDWRINSSAASLRAFRDGIQGSSLITDEVTQNTESQMVDSALSTNLNQNLLNSPIPDIQTLIRPSEKTVKKTRHGRERLKTILSRVEKTAVESLKQPPSETILEKLKKPFVIIENTASLLFSIIFSIGI